MDKKQTYKQKNPDKNYELENLLSVILAPVSPRGEFVHQLQHQLESKFDPKPLLIFPSKILDIILITLIGLFSGIFITTLGIKCIKKILKSIAFHWQCNQNTKEQTGQQSI